MELLIVRISYMWLIFMFSGLGIKFFKLSIATNNSCGCDHFRSSIAWMFLLSAVTFMVAFLNTFYPVNHYCLCICGLMTMGVMPFWGKVQ